MDVTEIIIAIATVIGIIAGIVQVIDYLQKRKEKEHKENKPLRHNLPNAQKFFGREKEIQTIFKILRPYPHSQEHLIIIDGVGGIGKSALAIEVAYRLMNNQVGKNKTDESFDAIVWTSAKTSILTTEGIISRPHIIRTLEQIYTTIAVTLGHPEVAKMDVKEQFDSIRTLLAEHRTLLIVDNLETIDDQAIVSFIKELPAPTKCIVTSRHRIDQATPIRLLGMEVQEALSLVQSEYGRKNISISSADAKKLIHRTGGVPLAIVLCVAQIAQGFDLEVILERLGKESTDIARFCFEYSLENISPNAWKMLMTLSMFSIGTTREILGAVTELPERDRDDCLVELEKFSLINRASNKFWMLPLSLEYVHDRMTQEPQDAVARLRHNFAKVYMNIKIESTESAKFKIQAVHLALDLADLFVWDTKIADYLQANRRAINRGVQITRIFVLEKKFMYISEQDRSFEPEIRRILNAQLQIGINVQILWREMIKVKKLDEPADMIIFDETEIHLHPGQHGGYYPEVIIPTEPDEIKIWQNRYAQWLNYSTAWFIMRREQEP